MIPDAGQESWALPGKPNLLCHLTEIIDCPTTTNQQFSGNILMHYDQVNFSGIVHWGVLIIKVCTDCAFL